MTTTPSIETPFTTSRMASTAAWSADSLSPRPIHRPAARAAASVTRASSNARLRSGAWRCSMTGLLGWSEGSRGLYPAPIVHAKTRCRYRGRGDDATRPLAAGVRTRGVARRRLPDDFGVAGGAGLGTRRRLVAG